MPRLSDIFTPNVILVDSMNLSKRYHHALQLVDAQGVPMGAPYGVLKRVHTLADKYPRAEFIFLWEGRTSFRQTLYPEYKAARKRSSDDTFYTSIRTLKKALSYWGIRQVYHPGMEADDLAGYYCAYYAPDKVLLLSNDHDWFQYVSPRVRLQMREGKLYGPRAARVKLGFPPGNIPIYKSLTGDTSDNIVGIPRFPKKLAAHLCNSVRGLADLRNRKFYNTDVLSVKVLDKWHKIVCDSWEHVEFVYGLIKFDPRMIVSSQIRSVRREPNKFALKSLLLAHGMNKLVNIFEG